MRVSFILEHMIKITAPWFVAARPQGPTGVTGLAPAGPHLHI